MSRPDARLAAAIALGLAIVAAACGLEPEEQVRRAIREAVEAAGRERFEALGEVVSMAYADDQGRTRQQLLDEARSYVERSRPVFFFTTERALEQTEAGRIEVELIVAAASTPMESLRDLASVGADVGVVHLTFRDEGGVWRVVRAAWRPASTGDFVPGRR